MFSKWNKMKKRACQSLSTFYDQPLAPQTNREKELIEALKSSFRELAEGIKAGDSPAEEGWHENVRRLKELVLHDDPREFLRWDVILNAMSVAYAGYLTTELKYLRGLPGWENRWASVVEESSVGHPIPHWQYPRSSGTLIHHAYHVAQFEEKTGMRINEMNFVFEFGGGYGSMCRVFHNSGFQGKYLIFDLPAFSKLQEFFLKSTGIAVLDVEDFESARDGVFCISDLEKLRTLLSHHDDSGSSMFVATWSISEAPLSFRQEVLPLVSGFRGFLIAYQERFGGVNNKDFFDNWSADQNGFEWNNWKPDHLPGHSRYLFGKSNKGE
jgi:hypothetical protein